MDVGTQKAIALCEQLLGDFERQQAKEDAELAKRPNAAEIAGTLQTRLAGALEREKRLQERVKELERSGSGKGGGETARK